MASPAEALPEPVSATRLRLSILVPMRNAEAYIAQTLRSLLAQDALSRDTDEIVVIDDGSTDRSRAVVEEVAAGSRCAIRIIDGPRHGISAAMNAGLAAARGDLVCRCDADDLYPPSRLRRQLQWLSDHPDFGAICGSFSNISSRGTHITDLECGASEQEITEELRSGTTRTHLCTFLMRADAIRQAGGFREWFVTAEDIDLQLRLGEVTRVGYEPSVAYEYRLHDGSITHQQADARRVFYESAARNFSAQRRQAGQDDLQRGDPPAPPAADAGNSKPRPTSEQVQLVLIGTAWKHHGAGRKLDAVRTGWRACLAGPTAVSAWKNLAALVLKRSGR